MMMILQDHQSRAISTFLMDIDIPDKTPSISLSVSFSIVDLNISEEEKTFDISAN